MATVVITITDDKKNNVDIDINHTNSGEEDHTFANFYAYAFEQNNERIASLARGLMSAYKAGVEHGAR